MGFRVSLLFVALILLLALTRAFHDHYLETVFSPNLIIEIYTNILLSECFLTGCLPPSKSHSSRESFKTFLWLLVSSYLYITLYILQTLNSKYRYGSQFTIVLKTFLL